LITGPRFFSELSVELAWCDNFYGAIELDVGLDVSDRLKGASSTGKAWIIQISGFHRKPSAGVRPWYVGWIWIKHAELGSYSLQGLAGGRSPGTLESITSALIAIWPLLEPKGASDYEAPTNQPLSGTDVSKGSKAITGSVKPILEPQALKKESPIADQSRSQCAINRG